MSFSEELGRVIGGLWAPAVRVGATLRHARLLHPEGITYRAEVKVVTPRRACSRWPPASRGPRWSACPPRSGEGTREWPDVLGLAVRLRSEESVTEQPAPGDQDTPLRHGALAVDARAGAVLHGHARLAGERLLRGVYLPGGGAGPGEAARGGQRRGCTGADAGGAARGRAPRWATALHLRGAAPQGRVGRPLVPARGELRLVEQVELDPATLRFWPFRTGRGVTPVGFVHSLRVPTYRQSQEARRLH